MRNMFIFLGFLILLVSCSIDPVTGKRTFNLIPEEQELEMGRTYDPQISAMYGVYDHPALQKYVAGLVTRLGKVSHRKQIPFKGKVMDSPVVNAFAIPGGYVYVTRGILAYLEDEAALAGVMGHEIGHVAARHSVEQMSKAQLMQLGLGIGAALSETFAQYAGIAQQGLGLLFLKFGRDDEREADKLGVEYATRIGYDTESMAAFFNVLDRMSSASGNSLPDFLSTHPNPRERVVKVEQLTKEWQKKIGKSNYKRNRKAYLKQINGLVFGNDPRQGYVENNVFYHPTLKFQFPVPAGWQTNNLPTQVQMIAADQKAVLIFKGNGTQTAEEAARVFTTNNKVTVSSQKNVRVNGRRAVEVNGTISGQQGALSILSYFIQDKKNVWQFLAYASSNDFPAFKATFLKTMRGFKTLNDPSKINRTPKRVHIKTLPRAMQWEAALSFYKVKDRALHQLLNSQAAQKGTLPKGYQLKVVY
ncbi:MAG: peptidase M48 [Calditrichaeota bacterium]|nr:MAG: peptidase M48 [Calditrichota bacterium]